MWPKYQKPKDKNMGWTKQKFRFSKKATKFEQSPTWFEVYLANVKSSGRLFQIFVGFSECPNFTYIVVGIYPRSLLELPSYA